LHGRRSSKTFHKNRHYLAKSCRFDVLKNLFMKYLFSLLLLATITLSLYAQNPPSPQSFLGYEPGERYTPHHKVVAYFQQLTQSMPGNMKMTQYGTTNEGRPLYVAFVSSASNISNLENIRQDNMKRAGLMSGAPATNIPIIWLSYNVHGNEPSSSEAAMQTAYELVTKHQSDWLANTLIVIDPCMNPDGRDRYVNWFNSVVGANGNALSFSREHQEPWPGGRVNHYYFDLNRDWAWQTQVETRQRLKIYNQWLPQIHVDYHEQGYNEPYYFAPAAEPFHEVITPWQRDFQTQIGRNHARYFDANGWLYFTKERFDLFYPSYGDTYPTYNGSIGMTYEQGGHSRGGLTVQTDNGDILTLKDRVAHHHTTGLSTVEITSQNAAKVLQNFQKFFEDGRNAVGSEYKSYILTSDDADKIAAVKKLLDANGITHTRLEAATGTGYNYFTAKQENIQLQKHSIAVSAYQPKSALAKVLLEPKGKLSDTATYDITAWSIPYAYGVKAYASAQRMEGKAAASAIDLAKIPSANYGLMIPYTSLQGGKLMVALLGKGLRVRMNEKPILYKGRNFDRGTLILLKKENAALWSQAEAVLAGMNAEPFVMDGGFMDKGPDMGSPDIKILSAPRIACLTGDNINPNATGEIWHLFDAQIPYPVTLLNVENLRMSQLSAFNVLILPDGYYKFLNDKNSNDDLKAWVRNGGRIVALESAVSQLAGADWGIKMKKDPESGDSDKKTEDYSSLSRYENRERDGLVYSIPGAIYRVEMDESHPLAFGYGKEFYTLKQSGDVIEFLKDGWNVGAIKKSGKISGFAGAKVTEKIKDGTVFGVQEMGRGAVIYLADNPMFRSFWEHGKLLFLNAVFLVGNNPFRL
jgi:hypothetical protein